MSENRTRFRLDQNRRAPIHEALEQFRRCVWYLLMCPVISGEAATRS